jgi:hypothetical protein
MTLVVVSFASSGSSATSAVLYAAYGGPATVSDLYLVNPGNAALASVGPIGFSVTGLAVHPSTGVLYGVTAGGGSASTRKLITVNKTTGAGTVVGSLGLKIADIAFDASGQLWGWSETGDDLASINITTGAATIVADSGFGTYGDGMSFDKNGVLYAMIDGSDDALYTINTTTGHPTSVATLSGSPNGGSAVNSASFGCDGSTLYAGDGGDGDPVYLVTVNTSTGEITSLGQLSAGGENPPIDALAWDCAGATGGTQINRLGYCSVAGNTNANTGTAIAAGTFLNLAAGQPSTDSHYTGATPARYFQGKGINCDAPAGYTLTNQTVGYGGPGDAGSYPYYTKP